MICAKKVGKFIRYYATQQISREDQAALNILRNRIPLHITLLLSLKHTMTRNDICKELEKSPSTVSYHLDRMIKHDIVQKFIHEGEVMYTLWNEAETDKLLIQYKETIIDDAAARFYDFFNGLKYDKGYRKIAEFIFNKDKVKMHSNFLFEIFPHPYWG